MKPNKKETNLLNDLKASEELCIEKYARGAEYANDKALKDLFNSIKAEEEQHLDSVNQMLNGKVPDMNSGSPDKKSTKKTENAKPYYKEGSNSEKKNADAYLCTDALSTEKHISSSYNTNIFEFVSSPVRDALNHIQKEEQEHGKQLYDYMHLNGMY